MTLAAALTAYAETVGDLLVNECDQPIPSRVLRYHGHAPPDELNCGDGILATWWAPTLTPLARGGGCPGYPTVSLNARWTVCWKIPEVDNSGVTLYDETWDGDAATLADAAECVSRGLMRTGCRDVPDSELTEPAAELRRLSNGDSLSFVSASPVGASGGVAGVLWIMTIGLRAETSGS